MEKKEIVAVMVVMIGLAMATGCGDQVKFKVTLPGEVEVAEGVILPAGTVVEYSRGVFGPENVAIKLGKFDLVIGDQATQRALIEKAFELGGAVAVGANLP